MERYTIQLLYKMAVACNVSYLDSKDAKPHFKNMLNANVISFLDINGAQAYITETDEYHIISFRGTEPSEWSDIKADLYALKETDEPFTYGKVHRGFKKEVDKLWPTLQSWLTSEQKKLKTLIITGHSLGAAMATIFSSRIKKFFQHTLVTFGSPRVGNFKFTCECNDVKHYRVQNNNDIVTRVAPAWMGFKHHGENVYLNHYGNIRKLTSWQKIKDQWRGRIAAFKKKQFFDGMYDHSMSHYIKALEKNV